MLPLVGYMALFLVIAVVFVAFHLLIGRFVRPNPTSLRNPNHGWRGGSPLGVDLGEEQC